jgi:hypothetical protein
MNFKEGRFWFMVEDLLILSKWLLVGEWLLGW